ncbi:hypothetical protein KAZ01_03750, partial [Candidatus Gracilibacteria bacterium]|nr:hypothetical protein [Candidatus Gracilibacteria bacterium]
FLKVLENKEISIETRKIVMQGYTNIGKNGSEERIRMTKNLLTNISKFFIETKSEFDENGSREKTKEGLSQKEFNKKWKKLENKTRIVKNRFKIIYPENNKLEFYLDVFTKGKLKGLVTIETRPVSTKYKKDFKKFSINNINWLKQELENNDFKNVNLVQKGLPEWTPIIVGNIKTLINNIITLSNSSSLL